jgi:membrane associated rhomboid family serine protease
MSPLLFLAVVVTVVVLRGMAPEDRTRFGLTILSALRFMGNAIAKPPAGAESFYLALRARTRWAIVTPTIVAAYAVVFVMMLFGSGSLHEPATLVAWGGNFGPRTTNGEWWRLGTSLLVHASVLHVIADTAGLVQTGLLVERMVGRMAFALVVLAAGTLSGIWGLTVHPVTMQTGAAGAVYGVYGLLIASLVWGLIERSALAMPLRVLKGLWPGVLIFVAYDFITEGFANDTMKAGLAVGLVGGMLISGHIVANLPPIRRVCAAAAATLAIVVALAAPLRGLADVAAEVARIRDAEARTVQAYDQAVDRFKRGRLNANELAAIADQNGSELKPFATTLGSMDNVPGEHQRMVTNALEYLRLRQESWRLRADGLRTGQPATLQKADVAEHAAREALDRAVRTS